MSVRLGAAATILLALAGVAMYATSWDRPHRPLMTWLAVAFAVGAAVLLLAPVERLLQSRLGSAFWIVWSAVSTAGIACFYWLDGGGRSPLAYGLVLALAFAGFLYAVPGAAAVAALVVGSYLLAALTRPHEPAEVAFVATALACAGVFCVCSAGWRDRQRAELRRLSRTDPLTGCLNRRGFEEAVAGALAAGAPFGLITLDLDGLKRVNDEAGHAAGDAVLCAAVGALRAAVRPRDPIGRLGGDEFAVLLPGATPELARRVADRAGLALSMAAPASCGLATHPEDGATADELFSRADACVYAEKAARAGRAPARP
ncbi:MAG: GGDEF domain-containing protein [Solirubrobacteraceae bacterium]